MRWMACIVALCLCAGCAFAQQAYPTKSIRLIVPYPPGGGADVMGRVLAEALSARFAQQVVVDNRGGARSAQKGPGSITKNLSLARLVLVSVKNLSLARLVRLVSSPARRAPECILLLS